MAPMQKRLSTESPRAPMYQGPRTPAQRYRGIDSTQVVAALRAGVNPSGNYSNQTSIWDLSSSFFFAGTVITTIGLGIIDPHKCNSV
ncbi:UNVERIFIED_CONTAM: hypothetical protein FKN15_013723 [Acipenser sinensis]